MTTLLSLNPVRMFVLDICYGNRCWVCLFAVSRGVWQMADIGLISLLLVDWLVRDLLTWCRRGVGRQSASTKRGNAPHANFSYSALFVHLWTTWPKCIHQFHIGIFIIYISTSKGRAYLFAKAHQQGGLFILELLWGIKVRCHSINGACVLLPSLRPYVTHDHELYEHKLYWDSLSPNAAFNFLCVKDITLTPHPLADVSKLRPEISDNNNGFSSE